MSSDLALHGGAAEERALSVAREAVKAAREKMVHAVNSAMVEAYWTIGKEIAETVGDRAEYGRHLIAYLSRGLTAEYGKGFSEANLRNMRQFYVSECAASNWSERELKRQIDTHLYERLLHTQEAVALDGTADVERALAVLHGLGGIKDAETDVAMSPFKDPYVFEFVDMPRNQHVLETDLESALIDSLEEFLLELGRGFSFVKRQRRLSDNGEDWWVDLVFYNIYLRRFVLFDLKTGKLDPRDVGQMDFYLSFFDDKSRLPGDEPSIGVLLCSEKDDAVAKYSALARNENLLAAQYFTYLPTEEELAKVLRRNRAEFEERLSRQRLKSADELELLPEPQETNE